MNSVNRIVISIFFLVPFISYSQDNIEIITDNENQKTHEIFGFVRGNIYSGIDHDDRNKPYISSAVSDISLKVEIENSLNFRAFADVRFRYGAEFLDPISSFNIREGFVKVNGRLWDLTIGQKIIKWGKADFTNPTSKLNSQNYIFRSPDREDMDMGNLLSAFSFYLSDRINLQAVAIPYYRTSLLIIHPIPLPENVTINEINSLLTGKEMFSYGLKADFHLKGIDWSMSWFDGYDPMPGTALSKFNLDLSGLFPIPEIEMTMTPYKTRVFGIDFETSAGNFGLRGEAAWSVPCLTHKTYEYVPYPEIKWVFGIDRTAGIWRITGEYSGKTIIDYAPSPVEPAPVTEPDYSQLINLLSIPGFDIEAYVRQQVAAFNRLYNYQLEKNYHSAGMRVEADLMYGRLAPSVFSMYNFTSHDFLIIPELKYKPSDRLVITAGLEFYSGPSDSLYDIVKDFMNSTYVSVRVSF